MRLAPGAWRYAVPLLVGGVLGAAISVAVGAVLVGLGLGVLYFFRDPERTPPPTGVLAPADGTVTEVRPTEEGARVAVFLSPTDVHVVRAPGDGAVGALEHRPGANRPAFSKESEHNERVELAGGDWQLSLIAGWFARRITTYVEEGERLTRGQRVGHIAFGSRVDVVLSGCGVADVAVAEGETVRAGETVIA